MAAVAKSQKSEVWLKQRIYDVKQLLRQGKPLDAYRLADACAGLPRTISPGTPEGEAAAQAFIQQNIAEQQLPAGLVETLTGQQISSNVPERDMFCIAYTINNQPRVQVIDCSGFSKLFIETALHEVMHATADPGSGFAVMGAFEKLVLPEDEGFQGIVVYLTDFLGDIPFDETQEPRLIDRLADIDMEAAEKIARAAADRHTARFMPKRKASA